MANDNGPIGYLERMEAGFRRMITGVFGFVLKGLPQWIQKTWQDFMGWLGDFTQFCVKLSVRIARVAFFASAWTVLVFGLLAVTVVTGSHSWIVNLAAFLWTCIGIAGSVWGLNRLRVKSKAGTPLRERVVVGGVTAR